MRFSGPRKSSKMPDFSRQKCEKCAFFVIFRKNDAHPNGVCTKIAETGVTTPDKAARKTCLQGRLSPGKTRQFIQY